MKSIISEGGPLIILNRIDVPSWSGVSGKTFVGRSCVGKSDYEATAYGVDGFPLPPVYTAVLEGKESSGLLIIEPRETALVGSNPSAVLIAQAIYAEPDWSYSSIGEELFRRLIKARRNIVKFKCAPGRFQMFDAAYPAERIGDDFVEFELSGGIYVVTSGVYEPDLSTKILLHCIVKE